MIILLSLFMIFETSYKDERKTTLSDDGFMIFDHDNIEEIMRTNLSKDFILIDYLYIIKGCTLSTFHRDVTSSSFIHKTKYPVYTIISYYNNGPLLALCPESHTTTPFLFQSPVIISGKPKTSILFNCDVVHAGALNNLGNNRLAIQRKICHKDDLKTLSHLIGIKKTNIGKCDKNNNNYYYFLRKISLMFSFVFNHLLTGFLQNKPQKDSISDYLIDKYYIGDFYNK